MSDFVKNADENIMNFKDRLRFPANFDMLDREVSAIYGDLDYTRCIDDIFDTPDAVTVIELKGEADGNKPV